MQRADAIAWAARQCGINARHGGGILGGLQRGLLGLDGFGDRDANFVELGSDFFLLVHRHIAHPRA